MGLKLFILKTMNQSKQNPKKKEYFEIDNRNVNELNTYPNNLLSIMDRR